MTKTRGLIYGVIVVGLLGYLYVARQKHDKATNAGIKSTTLKPTEQTKVIVDPRRHTITTVTRRADGGTDTKATFLPSGGASVSVGKNGGVLVTAPKWGTEKSPFVGGAFGSDIRLRAALGLNLVYFTRWELGAGVVSSNDVKDARMFVHVSYNPIDNYFVSLGVDHRHTVQLIAGLKF